MLFSRFMLCKGFVFSMTLSTHAVCLGFDFLFGNTYDNKP